MADAASRTRLPPDKFTFTRPPPKAEIDRTTGPENAKNSPGMAEYYPPSRRTRNSQLGAAQRTIFSADLLLPEGVPDGSAEVTTRLRPRRLAE